MSTTALYSRLVHAGDGATEEQMERVVQTIHETPIIDNHAHPLLKPDVIGRHPLLSIVSEAHGDAIHASVTALPHQRAIQQLSTVLGCNATWESVVAAVDERRRDDYDAWVSKCLSGLQTILLDDGLNNENDVFDFSRHDSFTRTKCHRIVRIEAVAAEIINRHCVAFDDFQPLDNVFDNMLEEFDTHIKQALSDPNVVGFKSVICYRTGLDVPRVVNIAAARKMFSDIIVSYSASSNRFHRLQHVGLNELFVHRAAVHIRDSSDKHKKPIQFHTGLGDNDITLTKSSPAHLQEFIRTYPTVPIVLLHSGYPYVRDTAYLATVYANVYADIGEVFPVVGRHGQEAIIRETFELCPWSKVMWSTDGHWFPETYLLAILQVREVLETVICDFVRNGQITWQSAIQLVQAILFGNANTVYNLGLSLSGSGIADVEKHVVSKGSKVFRPPDCDVWSAFMRDKPEPDFVRVSWLDYTALPRMRMIPFRRFDRLVRANKPVDIGITAAALGLLQSDTTVPGVTATGEYRLHPDFSSLKVGPIEGHFNINGEFREKDGSRVALCPRAQLIRAIEVSAAEGITHLLGFEIEFLLLQRTGVPKDALPGGPVFQMLPNDGHAWSTSRFYNDPALATFLRDIVKDLDSAGIEAEQVHAESAPGQFELVMPAKPPLEAVDNLLHAREIIAHRATEAGFKFTLHPKPFPQACGTASHVHMSISSTNGDGDDEAIYEQFYAGILGHLPAIMAFTYSNPVSYKRLVDSAWAGGRWVTWGTQNREAPLRKVDGSHWEMKCLDGLANPFMAMAAVLLAGLSGIVYKKELTWGDCKEDPARLTPAQRQELGISEMLPANLDNALTALEGDEELVRLIGRDVVERYATVKRAEAAALGSLTESEQRERIIEQY
ncbi:hypothetical protein SBRCBS47491_001761 [Sporothrix bragantina]|uniref:Glutamine synthetase n=1 Tax=Sporothrix bragantina TaxID=671064 RepID=A0ABP0B190_9PEZI